MEWLVLLHVLSAILGLGPAYAFPLVMKKTKSGKEMLQFVEIVGRLEIFPKAFGTIAVLSGLVLFWVGSYGAWTQVWIIGTLVVYAVTEVLVIGFLNPAAKRLQEQLSSASADTAAESPSLQSLYARVRNLHVWACALGLVIYGLMIMKP